MPALPTEPLSERVVPQDNLSLSKGERLRRVTASGSSRFMDLPVSVLLSAEIRLRRLSFVAEEYVDGLGDEVLYVG